eukprot:GFYU01006750.1.p1 GENE.GFYU01006750.1~~GFYU01006750.1.p1  ORF type:complete len:1003 (-),score=256.65 GFYU01006750.1:206-3214(-)
MFANDYHLEHFDKLEKRRSSVVSHSSDGDSVQDVKEVEVEVQMSPKQEARSPTPQKAKRTSIFGGLGLQAPNPMKNMFGSGSSHHSASPAVTPRDEELDATASATESGASETESEDNGEWADVDKSTERVITHNRLHVGGKPIRQAVMNLRMGKGLAGQSNPYEEFYVVLRDDCILLFKHFVIVKDEIKVEHEHHPSAVILLIDVDKVYRSNKHEHGFKVISQNVNRKFKCASKKEADDWVHDIKHHSAANRVESPEVSYTPPRARVEAEFFVCGRDYYERLCSELLKAKKEVFIADWMLSPKIYLVRGNLTDKEKLDDVEAVHRDDNESWRDVTDSDEDESSEEDENAPRFKMGGANSASARLRDIINSKVVEPKREEKKSLWNTTIRNTRLYLKRRQLREKHRLDNILRRLANNGVRIYVLLYREQEMALALKSAECAKYLESLHGHIFVIRHGPPFKDIYYSHHQKCVVIDQQKAFVGGLDLAVGRFDDKQHHLFDPHDQIWRGMDFYNPEVAEIARSHDWEKDVVDRTEHPRLPWQDIHCMVTGKAAGDVALNFVQRWNSHRLEMSTGADVGDADANQFDSLYNMTPPAAMKKQLSVNQKMHAAVKSAAFAGVGSTAASTADTPTAATPGTASSINSKKLSAARKAKKKYPFLTPYHHEMKKRIFQRGQDLCCVQVCRSFGFWHGSLRHEASIHAQYMHAIESAEHYIYIENQFFVSSGADRGVKNKVSEALRNRLVRAIKERAKFRVMVVIPVWPDGPLETNAACRAVMHLQFRTISRGKSSLLESLRKEFPDVDLKEYISFHTLHNFGVLNGKAVHNRIYIHSKLLIVDDRLAIVGSANINDRSLNGTRDSELAVVVFESAPQSRGVMNGKPYDVLKCVRNLRLRIWANHLGMKFKDAKDRLADPVSDSSFREMVQDISTTNTDIYKTVFPSFPSSDILHLSDYKKAKRRPSGDPNKLRGIHGHLVDFPQDFLSGDRLKPGVTNKEFLANYAALFG